MSSKKKPTGTRYCRIFQWIEEQDPEFAAAITRLCLEGALSPTHNPGVTFLYPDAKTRAELVKQAYGDDADAAEAAILAHIVPVYVETGDAFATAGNRLGTAFSAAKATSGSAEIAPGVEVRREPGFRPMERQAAKLAVWRVTAGAVPTTAPEPAQRWRAPRAPRSFGEEKKGAAEPPAGPSERYDRYRVARHVEKEFAALMDASPRCTEDPYLDKVASFLEWAASHDEDAYHAVLPLLDLDPAVTFYLLFEPYRSTERGRGGDGYVVSDACLSRWALRKATSGNYDEAVRSFQRHYKAAAERAGETPALVAETDKTRCDLLELKRSERCKGVYDAYTARYGDAWARWLWRDEFRHCIGTAFYEMRRRWEHAAYKSIVTSIQTVWTGADPNRRALCTDLQRDVSGQSIKALNFFVNSSDFLYQPYTWDYASKPWGTGKEDDSPHNRSAASASYLGGLTKMSGRKRRGRKSASASGGASSLSEVADGDFSDGSD